MFTLTRYVGLDYSVLKMKYSDYDYKRERDSCDTVNSITNIKYNALH